MDLLDPNVLAGGARRSSSTPPRSKSSSAGERRLISDSITGHPMPGETTSPPSSDSL